MSSDRRHHLVLVLGTPCGGTTYLAGRLCGAGYEVGHESHKIDGMVCGFAHLSDPRQVEGRSYEKRWRVIRSPMSVLETLPSFISRGPFKTHRRAPVECAEEALRWWLAVHESLMHLPTLRVEHFEEDFPHLLADLAKAQAPGEHRHDAGYMHHKGRRFIPRDWDPKGPKAWTWEYARALWPEMVDRAYAICEAYDITADPPVRDLDTRRRRCGECGRPWPMTLRVPVAVRHCKTCLRAWAQGA
jgi:hypothetical protein